MPVFFICFNSLLFTFFSFLCLHISEHFIDIFKHFYFKFVPFCLIFLEMEKPPNNSDQSEMSILNCALTITIAIGGVCLVCCTGADWCAVQFTY